MPNYVCRIVFYFIFYLWFCFYAFAGRVDIGIEPSIAGILID